MPKLSKFRVVNLIYNDTRHIYDEVFDFSGGSNAMMLLANGGGKTVLTQMMMQTVIPKTDLKTRKFADYFKNNHKPTLLMSEWLLDSDAGKILMGLVIQNKVRRKRGQDDDQDVLNITAFVIEYHRAETYNIDTIPVIQRDAQGHRLMRSYDDITAELDKHARKHKGMARVFNWSDSAEAKRMYGQALGEYGIVQQEWQDTILKINKEEAGLQSFFNDAKKSETLIQRKILPIIESKLDENNTEKVEIQSLVKSHAQLLVKNDKIIRDEVIYNRFITESILYENDLFRLKESEEALDLAMVRLSQVYYGFKNLSVRIEDEIVQLEDLKKINRQEQQKIRFEEACFDFYNKWDQNEMKIDEAKQLRLEKNDLEAKFRHTQLLENTQEAIKLYHAIVNLEEKVTIKQEELRFILSDEKEFDIDALMAVLLEKYGIEKLSLDTFKAELLEALKSIEGQLDALKVKERQLHQDIRENRDQETRYLTLINQFDEQVNHINEQNPDFKWEKHPLLKEYDLAQLEAYLQSIHEKSAQIHAAVISLEEQIRLHDEEIINNGRILSEEKVALNVLDNTASNQNNELKRYRERYYKVQQSLEQYGILRETFYQDDEVNSLLSMMISEREAKRHHLILEKAIITQRMESLKAGQLNALSDDFASFLDVNHIGYEFGYNWLLNYKGDAIPESLYLEKLTIMPYALIMSSEDLNRFKGLIKSYHLTMVIPILTHEYIYTVLKGDSTQSDEVGLYYHTSFDKKLMEIGYREKEISKYEVAITKIEDDSERILLGIESIRQIYYEYLEFIKVYDSTSEKRLNTELESTQGEIERLQDSIKNRQKFIDGTRAKNVTNRETLKRREEESRSATQLISQYLQLKVNYLEALSHTEKKNQIHLRIVQNESALTKNNEEIEHQNTNRTTNLQRSHKNDEALEKINLEIIKFESAIKAESIQNLEGHPFRLESIKALEAKYIAYNQSHGQVKDIQNLIDEWQGQISEKQEQLAKLQVDETQYKSFSYDAVQHKALKESVQTLQKEIKRQDDELLKMEAVIEDRRQDLKSSISVILSQFAEASLASRESIIMIDFKARKNENQKQYKQYDEQIAKFDRLTSAISSSISRFEDGADSDFRETEVDELSINITEREIVTISDDVLQSVRQLRKKVNAIRLGLTESYNKLNLEFNRDNVLLKNLFQNLFKGQNSYSYDFTKRVFEQARTSIEVMLKKHETDLKNVKESEEKLNDFVLERVATVYEQLREIDKHSTIELKDKYQKMLYIEMPKKDTLDVTKLKNYLMTVIHYCKHRMEDNEVSDLDKYLDSHLSLDKLFDEYVPIRSITVSISKIEQNKVTKIPWEAVGKVSGGEEFVSVFILFISLMSYTRGYQLSRKQSGKVLVMDNPFGPVSSEHLLEPLFKIAKTYDAQLICFTHINTSAITSQFDLIYSLRVVRDAGSSQERVDVKLTKDVRSGVEFLESGIFETGDVEQLEWF
jgi:DNA repair exonuclease SbcCD ATPase subunit